jgi:hypothetical protein
MANSPAFALQRPLQRTLPKPPARQIRRLRLGGSGWCFSKNSDWLATLLPPIGRTARRTNRSPRTLGTQPGNRRSPKNSDEAGGVFTLLATLMAIHSRLDRGVYLQRGRVPSRCEQKRREAGGSDQAPAVWGRPDVL